MSVAVSLPRSAATPLWAGGQFRLIFEADHEAIPELSDGGIDRTRVTKIVIKEVVDYHGK